MLGVKVKFLIDREEKRVVCAEVGSDFIDVLFSFLTLPVGSISRLLGKQSGLGSLDSLYQGVERLDNKHFQTNSCKEMLLNPRSAAAITCEDLYVKYIIDGNPRKLYYCHNTNCLDQSKCGTICFSFERECACPHCGSPMYKSSYYRQDRSKCGGIFVDETVSFLITDNLRVIPTSFKAGCSLLKEFQIKDSSVMEKKEIKFGTKETMDLLRKLLVFKNPFTEVCFPDACLVSKNPLTKATFPDVNCSSTIKQEVNVKQEESEITLNLILNRKTNSVLYAEVGSDFVNQLLSFLTFPLGSVFTHHSNNISKLGGCINNLYSSVKNMGLDCFKSENCRNMLLFPKLAAFYGIEKQILNMEELTPTKLYVRDDPILLRNYRLGNQHELDQLVCAEQNPKSKKLMTNIGRAFVVESIRFVIADNLHILPLSFISAIPDEMNFSISDLVEKEVCLDKAKTMSLLSTMLISKTVLTDVFMCPTKEDKEDDFW